MAVPRLNQYPIFGKAVAIIMSNKNPKYKKLNASKTIIQNTFALISAFPNTSNGSTIEFAIKIKDNGANMLVTA